MHETKTDDICNVQVDQKYLFGQTYNVLNEHVQYVAQFSYGPSFRTKRTLFDYFRRSFNSSSTEEFQKLKEHFSYKLPVLPGFLTKKQVSADNFFRGE